MAVSLEAILREMRRNIDIHARGNFTSKDREERDSLVQRIVDYRGEHPVIREVDFGIESVLIEEVKTLVNG